MESVTSPQWMAASREIRRYRVGSPHIHPNREGLEVVQALISGPVASRVIEAVKETVDERERLAHSGLARAIRACRYLSPLIALYLPLITSSGWTQIGVVFLSLAASSHLQRQLEEKCKSNLNTHLETAIYQGMGCPGSIQTRFDLSLFEKGLEDNGWLLSSEDYSEHMDVIKKPPIVNRDIFIGHLQTFIDLRQPIAERYQKEAVPLSYAIISFAALLIGLRLFDTSIPYLWLLLPLMAVRLVYLKESCILPSVVLKMREELDQANLLMAEMPPLQPKETPSPIALSDRWRAASRVVERCRREPLTSNPNRNAVETVATLLPEASDFSDKFNKALDKREAIAQSNEAYILRFSSYLLLMAGFLIPLAFHSRWTPYGLMGAGITTRLFFQKRLDQRAEGDGLKELVQKALREAAEGSTEGPVDLAPFEELLSSQWKSSTACSQAVETMPGQMGHHLSELIRLRSEFVSHYRKESLPFFAAMAVGAGIALYQERYLSLTSAALFCWFQNPLDPHSSASIEMRHHLDQAKALLPIEGSDAT